MSASAPGAEVTFFTKAARPNDPYRALLSKRITLISGKVVSDGDPCKMVAGTAIVAPVPTAEALAGLIRQAGPANALALGTVAGGNGTAMNVVTKGRLRRMSPEQRGSSTIARSRDYVVFRPGVPAWMLLDFDAKGMPAEVRGRLDAAGGLWGALCTVVPGLVRAARVSRLSTSSGLVDTTTGMQFPGTGGVHLYVQVRDGADVDRCLQALHERCWLHGLGWVWIGDAGGQHVRSIIDAAVRFPERLCFEGAPEVVPPLMQDVTIRAPVAVEGEVVDTGIVIPTLTRDEKQQVRDAIAAAKRACDPEAHVIRAAADGRLVEDLVRRTGVPHATAARQVAARHRGILTPDIVLVFDHFGAVSVREVLANQDKYLDEPLCDPIEGPAYGYGKALVMRSQSNPGCVFIHSFAHGGATYDLKHDLRSAQVVIEAAPLEHLGDVLGEVVDAADLEEDEIKALISLCARRKPDTGPQKFMRRLADDRKARAQARRREAAFARQAEGATDNRQRRKVPPPDGELTPVVEDIDRVLAADGNDYPPMRRPDGTLVELRLQAPFAMHELAATGANADPDAEAGVLPAPAEPLLVTMTAVTVETMIERYFVWERTSKDGTLLYHATLPRPFIDAFMQIDGVNSKLPTVRAVNTAPMIALDGTIIDGVGLDRSTGLLHCIDPMVRACIPQGEITADDVRTAVRWLCDELLCDVLTDFAGKMVAISAMLALIERHLLPERPAYPVSAGQRGGGKTTLIHMVFMVVLGRRAAAASWSENQEERRKSLFAKLRQRVAGIVWDNVKNGTALSCPEIEKALTSPTIEDRVLGVSRNEEVPTTPIQFFVGNNISFAGDLASRGPGIRLRADEPRPEDRPVKHTDPVGWARDNRATALRYLYTILLHCCRNRPAGQNPKTRFRTWWRLCGEPVELAASLIGETLDFNEVFKETEDQDSTAAGVVAALQLLRQEFGAIDRATRQVFAGTTPSTTAPPPWFRARDIRAILDEGDRARMLLRAGQGDQVKIDRASLFLELVAELSKKRNLNPITSVIGTALSAIIDRPVELDSTTVGILRSRTSRGNQQFHVEIHSSAGGGGVGSQTANSPVGTGSQAPLQPHHPHHNSEGEDVVEPESGGGGGAEGALAHSSPPAKSRFAKDVARRPHPADGASGEGERLPAVEELSAAADWSSTSERSPRSI